MKNPATPIENRMADRISRCSVGQRPLREHRQGHLLERVEPTDRQHDALGQLGQVRVRDRQQRECRDDAADADSEARREAALHHRRVVLGVRVTQVEQHDHEQEQHHDGTAVDEHLDRGEELEAGQQVRGGDPDEGRQEPQHAVHRIAREHDAQGRQDRERGCGVEDEVYHRSLIRFT